MSDSIFVYFTMLPIYLGWALMLAGPVIFIAWVVYLGLRRGRPHLSKREAKLLSNLHIVHIKILEDGNPLVDFSENFPQISLTIKALNSERIRGRKMIGQMLVRAQELLPRGYHLMIRECFRSSHTERLFQEKHVARVLAINPQITTRALAEEYYRLENEYEQSGRQTGGALDITLADDDGIELDLGPRESPSVDWFGKLRNGTLSPTIIAHRALLSGVLRKVGFVASDLEWWHWSYGDQKWGKAVGAGFAIYGDRVG